MQVVGSLKTFHQGAGSDMGGHVKIEFWSQYVPYTSSPETANGEPVMARGWSGTINGSPLNL